VQKARENRELGEGKKKSSVVSKVAEMFFIKKTEAEKGESVLMDLAQPGVEIRSTPPPNSTAQEQEREPGTTAASKTWL
jgi:hypothetical protein